MAAEDVGRPLHSDGEVAVLLLYLVVGHGGGAVIGHGSGHDQNVHLVEAAGHGLVHLLGCRDGDILGEPHRLQGRRAVDEGDFGTPRIAAARATA